MVTSLTCPSCTLAMNSVKVSCCSRRPWPVRTTANNSTTRQMRTTQKINVLILEFTKPPHRRPHVCRRVSGPSRFLFRSYGVFPDLENHLSIRLRRHSGCGPETPRPNDRRSVRDHRPMPTLPQWDAGLLKEGLDLLLAGVPRRLVLIARPPVPQFQGPRQALPIQATHRFIIYPIGGHGRSRFINQFQRNSEIGARHPHPPRHGQRQAVIAGIHTTHARTAETQPLERTEDVEPRRL